MSPPLRAVPATCVVLAAVVVGMLFAPVFGVPALLFPIGVPALAVLLTTLACARRKALLPWRPLLLAVVGLLAVVETVLRSTTVAGLPTGRTLRALAAGVTGSWQLALQSTWPARPDPELLLFVPLLVVLAGVLGVELLDRPGSPLLALAPSFAVALLSQFYAPLPPGPAVAAALGYAAVAGVLLATGGGTESDRAGPPRSGPRPIRSAGHRRGGRIVAAWGTAAALLPRIVPAVALAGVAVMLAGLLPPTVPPRYSLGADRTAPLAETRVASPLDEIAYRLAHPGTAVFRVSGGEGVDRWPLVVLEGFDGVNWHPGGRYRRLGIELRPGPAVTVPVHARSAEIEIDAYAAGAGPWLPSQTWPAGVRDVDPLVEEDHGTLLLPGSDGAARYTLSWWQPAVDAEALAGAAIDPVAPGGLGGVGPVPSGVAELAERATGGLRPSFQAALVLERFLRENYRLATGQDLPTGHSWPQLADFLLQARRGTTEQFAAAYVALARIRGIPARLVVGFRAPTSPDPDGRYTVRNGDVLAWPEVAVQGIGWVPLDPAGGSSAGGAASGAGLSAAAAQVRAQLPAPEELRDPSVALQQAAVERPDSAGLPGTAAWRLLLAAPVVLLAVWIVGVPAATAGRAWRRRRRPGTGAVVGAWEEVRDRLRAHGVLMSAGMTVRDLATSATAVADRSTVTAIRELAAIVDRALWAPAAPGERDGRQAWAAVRAVRRGLARRGWRARLRALLDPRALLPPR
ncbi:transglutaminase-like domain-containing protein [Plantactinospora sp. ZYX-F-223]|uniref:transglutaminase-like domain-containing protein n=1 Tax=Plantactinospora sp. ZYX-F-223 TaxID=3144103 RepID=UPI0031FBCEE5